MKPVFLTRRDHDAFVIDVLAARTLTGDLLATRAREAFLGAKKTWSLGGVSLAFRSPRARRDWDDACSLFGGPR